MITRRSFIAHSAAVFGWMILPVRAMCADNKGTGPKPGSMGFDENGHMQISPSDRCPVCAMRPHRHPKAACAMVLTDGNTYYFCSSKCMIRCRLQPHIYLKVAAKNIRQAVVREYFTGEHLSADSVTWVAGSDVIGPMGPAVVPLKGAKHLETFRRRHGGRASFSLQDLTVEKWQALTGKKSELE